MKTVKTRKLVFTALLAAMCCVATMLIRIPSLTGGYINPGDAIVLLGSFLLGPLCGAVAAGVGSAAADLLAGYAAYAPATFIIKALMALAAGLLLRRSDSEKPLRVAVFAAVIAEVIMIAGYFLFTALVLGLGWGALLELPGNAVQGVFGAVVSVSLFLALRKAPYIRELNG